MLQAAVRSWFKIVLMGATALFGAFLLVAGPAGAADVTTTTTQPTTSATTAPYGPATQPSTIAPTTAPVTKPATIAFTGADIAAMAAVGAVAIGVGGTLILVSRRRRAASHESA